MSFNHKQYSRTILKVSYFAIRNSHSLCADVCVCVLLVFLGLMLANSVYVFECCVSVLCSSSNHSLCLPTSVTSYHMHVSPISSFSFAFALLQCVIAFSFVRSLVHSLNCKTFCRCSLSFLERQRISLSTTYIPFDDVSSLGKIFSTSI